MEIIINELVNFTENMGKLLNQFLKINTSLIIGWWSRKNKNPVVIISQNRVNIKTDCPEKYFSTAIEIPLFDGCISQLY